MRLVNANTGGNLKVIPLTPLMLRKITSAMVSSPGLNTVLKPSMIKLVNNVRKGSNCSTKIKSVTTKPSTIVTKRAWGRPVRFVDSDILKQTIPIQLVSFQ